MCFKVGLLLFSELGMDGTFSLLFVLYCFLETTPRHAPHSSLFLFRNLVLSPGLILEFSFFFFWPRLAACGILVSLPGMEPVPPAVEVQSPNQWTAREVPILEFSYLFFVSVHL